MALTKVTNSMILGDVFSVLDYADLVFTHTAKAGGTNTIPSFQSWKLAIQAACDAAWDNGGGTVLLPCKGSPYLIDNQIVVKSNTRFICDEWIELGDYTTLGHSFVAAGENIEIINLKIDNNLIYNGISGDNAAVVDGLDPATGDVDSTYKANNIKFIGGHVKNCSFGTVDVSSVTGAPLNYYYGGKAFQFETNFENVMVDNVTVENCAMAISNVLGSGAEYGPTVYSNITAIDCGLLAYFSQSTGTQSASATGENELGDKVQIVLTNFVAVNCAVTGAQNGDLMFAPIVLDGAEYVNISNGTVVNSGAAFPKAFVRGRHRYCSISNVTFAGECDSIINNATTRDEASGYNGIATIYLESAYNKYKFVHQGDHGHVLDSEAGQTYSAPLASMYEVIADRAASVSEISSAGASRTSFIELLIGSVALYKGTTYSVSVDKPSLFMTIGSTDAVCVGTDAQIGDLDNTAPFYAGKHRTYAATTNTLGNAGTQDFTFTQATHGKSAWLVYASGNVTTTEYAYSIMRLDNSSPPAITLVSLGNSALAFSTPSAGTLRFTNGTTTQSSDLSFIRIA